MTPTKEQMIERWKDVIRRMGAGTPLDDAADEILKLFAQAIYADIEAAGMVLVPLDELLHLTDSDRRNGMLASPYEYQAALKRWIAASENNNES